MRRAGFAAIVALLAAATAATAQVISGTGIAVGSLSGLAAGVAAWLAAPSSANLITAVTDETGSGALVFGTSPTLDGPIFATNGPLLNNTVPLRSKDSGGSPRSIIQMFSDNRTYVDGGSGGVALRTNNAATTAFTIDGSATKPLMQWGAAAGVPAHLSAAQTTAPALTSCGGGSPAITGTDIAGTVTMGTTATGCVITFNVAYVSAPHCVVTWIATPLASQSYATSNTAITLTQTSASGNVVKYICIGQAGG